MEEEEVAADTTSSLTIKGTPVKVKRHRFEPRRLGSARLGSDVDYVRGEFEEPVIVALIARLPAPGFVTPGLHTCARIAAFVIKFAPCR